MRNKIIPFLFLLLSIAGCSKHDDDSNSNNNGPNIPPETIVLTTEKKPGEYIYIEIDAKPADREGVWIDLNNNAQKDAGETVADWNVNLLNYKVASSKITVHGSVIALYVGDNKLTAIEANSVSLKYLGCDENMLKTLNTQKLPKLQDLDCSNNQLSTLDFSANPDLGYLECYENMIQGTGMDKLVQSLPKKSKNNSASIDIINTGKNRKRQKRMYQSAGKNGYGQRLESI